MKEKFLSIPASLQKQILMRLAGSGIGIVTLLLVLSSQSDWRLLLPCFALIVFCAISAATLYNRCIQNRYVAVTGSCVEIERTVWRRRIKTLYLRTDKHSIKLVGARPIRNLVVGDLLTVYITDNTSVYEVDGCQVVCNCLAIEKALPKRND